MDDHNGGALSYNVPFASYAENYVFESQPWQK